MKTLVKALMVSFVTIVMIISDVYAYTLETSNEVVENYNYTGTAVPVYNNSTSTGVFLVGISDTKNLSITGQSSAYFKADLIIRNDNVLDTTEKSVTVTEFVIAKTNSREWNPVLVSFIDGVTGQLIGQVQGVTYGSTYSVKMKTNHLYRIALQATVYPPLGGSATASVAFTLPVETPAVAPTNTKIDVHQDNRCTSHAGDTP